MESCPDSDQSHRYDSLLMLLWSNNVAAKPTEGRSGRTMQPSPNQVEVEHQLLDYVKRLERNPYDWRAVHLHLSQLRAQNRRQYQLRIAASEFDRKRPAIGAAGMG